MRKKIMTLMMGMLLLLTACGQTGSNSPSTMLPVTAVQSATAAIAPVDDKVQENAESLLVGEDTEIILPKPKDNESTLEIRFQDGRWVRLVGYLLYKTGAKQLLDALCEIAARYPDEDDEDEA